MVSYKITSNKIVEQGFFFIFEKIYLITIYDNIAANKVLQKVCYTGNNYVDRIWFHILQQVSKDLSRDIVCMFEFISVITIYHNIAVVNIIINHINIVAKSPRTKNLLSFQKYFIRKAKLYICILTQIVFLPFASRTLFKLSQISR